VETDAGVISDFLRDKKLEQETDRLRLEVVRLIASKKPGGQIDSDFCRFPSTGQFLIFTLQIIAIVGKRKYSFLISKLVVNLINKNVQHFMLLDIMFRNRHHFNENTVSGSWH
jgi:hypothetical protein